MSTAPVLPAGARAAVVGIAGTRLSSDEADLLRRLPPAGVILFARNCIDRPQLGALVAEIRGLLGPVLVLVDQEGGRVMRLRPPGWAALPSAGAIGALAPGDPAAAREAAWLQGRLIARDLAELDIDLTCAPVLDVRAAGAHEVVGDRAFSEDPTIVADLGAAFVDGLAAGGVLPMIKHLPGHGRARVDSHHELPVIPASDADLAACDLVPFRRLRHLPFAMTAHVLLPAIDEQRPATQSATVIRRLIRGAIGFEGVLFTDDIGMRALAGGIVDRARAALGAGCDVVTHCTGDLDETTALLGDLPPLSARARAGIEAALAGRRARAEIDADGFDPDRARARLCALVAGPSV